MNGTKSQRGWRNTVRLNGLRDFVEPAPGGSHFPNDSHEILNRFMYKWESVILLNLYPFLHSPTTHTGYWPGGILRNRRFFRKCLWQFSRKKIRRTEWHKLGWGNRKLICNMIGWFRLFNIHDKCDRTGSCTESRQLFIMHLICSPRHSLHCVASRCDILQTFWVFTTSDLSIRPPLAYHRSVTNKAKSFPIWWSRTPS